MPEEGDPVSNEENHSTLFLCSTKPCRKDNPCIVLKPSNRPQLEPNIHIKEDFDFAEALASVYPLLEIVFRYLNYTDLKAAALVKKSWYLAAKKVLARRNSVSWITLFHKKKQFHTGYSYNYHYGDVNVGFFIYGLQRRESVSRRKSFCCHEEDSSKRKMRFSDFLSEKVVPANTEYCVLSCTGVNSVFPNLVKRTTRACFFDGCFIPPIPNIKVSMFYCNLRQLQKDYIKPNERLRCLLLFCKNDLNDKIYDIFDHMSGQDFQNVALGGGVIQSATLSKRDVKLAGHSFCIAFTENSNNESAFDAFSFVISEDALAHDLTPEDFEDELLKFKKKVIMRNSTLAFRFSCAANMSKSLKSETFTKVFPNTVLLSLYVDGEIGWNSLNEEQGSKGKKSRRYQVAQHIFSTVIVFVTWGAFT